MCRPNETHQDHRGIYLPTYLYYISTARRHTTGEPGDLLLYSCSSFRVPFIAYTHTHTHTQTRISECCIRECVCVYEFFFSYSLSIPFFPFLRPFDRIRLARTRSRARSPTRSVSVHSATGTTAPPTHRDICQLKTRRRSISAARAVRVRLLYIILFVCRVFQPADSAADIRVIVRFLRLHTTPTAVY